MKFRDQQRLIIVAATFAGLYMPSIEHIISNRFITKTLRFLTIIPFLSLTVFTGAAIKHLIWNEANALMKAYSLGFVCGFYLLVFKCAFYNWNNERFERIFDLWDSSFSEDLFADRREEMFQEKKKHTNRYIKILMTQCILACFLWSIPPFFIESKTLTHPSGFDYRHVSPDYELLCSFELLVGFYGSSLGLAFDSLLMVLLSLEEVQLHHLKTSLADIVDTIKVNSEGDTLVGNNRFQEPFYNKTQDSGDNVAICMEKGSDFELITLQVRKKLLLWISQHQQIIRYHEELRKIYYSPLCVQFSNIVMSVVLILFLSALGVFTPMETAFCAIFFTGNYAMFYITCRIGDTINVTSGSIFEEAFSKAWYVYPQPIQTLFHIIIMQSQKPLDVVAFDIYPLGARSFFKIFKTAYTFFTFMLQTVNKKRT